MAGIEEITGTFGYNVVREKMNEWDNKYLRKLLMREPPQEKDLRIWQTYKKLSYKDAENYLVTHQYSFLPKNYSNASLERTNTYGSSDGPRCTHRQNSFIGSIATQSIDVIVPPAPYENNAMPTSPILARNALKNEIKFSSDIEKRPSNHHLALLVGRSNTKKKFRQISKYMLPDEDEDEKHHRGIHWRRRYRHHHSTSNRPKARTSSFTHDYVHHHQIQPVLHHHHHYHA